MIPPRTYELLNLEHTLAKELFENSDNPFDFLPKIKEFTKALGKTLPKDTYTEISENVWVANDASIVPTATILPPTIIGRGTEVRPGAYIRGAVIIGDGAVIGNSTEIKNAVIFDGVQIPHYNYVGDSALGYKAHLGAGAIISNFKLDHTNIKVRSGGDVFETGLRKCGAILADGAELGCNSVIFPGTIIGRGTIVYPLTPVRGIIPENSILRSDGTLTVKN